jgi:hypothetical protein
MLALNQRTHCLRTCAAHATTHTRARMFTNQGLIPPTHPFNHHPIPPPQSLSQVRLMIIDEIHLLHDSRGPVLESIVARTIRCV